MSQASRDLIANYYAAFNHADWGTMLDLLDEQVAHDISQGGREVGREAFRAFLARMARHYLEALSDIRILVSDDGRHAAAEYIVSGQYLVQDEGLPPARGQRYRLPGAAFFEIRDGRITRVSNHYNLRDWVAQVSE